MTAPELSLICPMYGTAAYLPGLIDSLVAGANSPALEVIFVDDCCPQNSARVCQAYLDERAEVIAFQYSLLRLPRNGGPGNARNLGVDAARGTYIGFIDSDDQVTAQYAEFLLPRIATSDADIIEFGFREFSDQGDCLPLAAEPNTQLHSSQLTPFQTQFFLWSRIFRAALVRQLQFQCETIYEDVGYVLAAYARARSSERHSAVLVRYRKRTGSITATRKADYARLLINLVAAASANHAYFQQRGQLLALLTQKSLLVLLKGARIQQRRERQRFYHNCSAAIAELRRLVMAQPRPGTQLYLLGCRLLCALGSKL